ncbi:hypothetical protein [Psychrobacillus phage Spoks]|nr:hypothetical protein [Psychrobacillus phage Spoks]
MPIDVYQEDLDFLEESKDAFNNNLRLEPYRNDKETHIALRYGLDRDCIKICKLGESVLFANNVMNKAPQLVVMKNDEGSENS